MTTRPLTRPGPRVGYRLLTVLAGAMLAVWASASLVWAHNSVTSTNPADQEVVQSAPQAVVLTFDEPVIATGTQVVVTGPSGQIQQGQPRLAENTVTQDLQPGAPAGACTVAWRVTSADGHPVSGTFSFTAKPAATYLPTSPETSPPATPDQTEPTRMPGWLKLVVGAVAIIFGVTSHDAPAVAETPVDPDSASAWVGTAVIRAVQTLSSDLSAATRRRKPVASDGGAESHL